MISKNKRIIQPTWSSSTFTLLNGNHQILVENHTGGDWILYIRSGPTEPWLDTNISFAGNGIQLIEAIEGAEYRFSGGSIGATAYVVPLYGGVSPMSIEGVI